MDQRGAVPLVPVPTWLPPRPDAAPSRGRGRCNVFDCGFAGPVEDVPTSQARMVWHVHVKHRDLWDTLTGGAATPRDPRPAGAIE